MKNVDFLLICVGAVGFAALILAQRRDLKTVLATIRPGGLGIGALYSAHSQQKTLEVALLDGFVVHKSGSWPPAPVRGVLQPDLWG
jgi:hypothetical protein